MGTCFGLTGACSVCRSLHFHAWRFHSRDNCPKVIGNHKQTLIKYAAWVGIYISRNTVHQVGVWPGQVASFWVGQTCGHYTTRFKIQQTFPIKPAAITVMIRGFNMALTWYSVINKYLPEFRIPYESDCGFRSVLIASIVIRLKRIP